MRPIAILILLFALPLTAKSEPVKPEPASEEPAGPLMPRPPVSVEVPPGPTAQNDSAATVETGDPVGCDDAAPGADSDDIECGNELASELENEPVPDESGRAQVACDPAHCAEVELDEISADRVAELMKKQAGQILVRTGDDGVSLKHASLQPLRGFLRGIADREGRVSVEPVYVREKGTSPLFVKDVISVSWSIISYLREKIVYRHTDDYHGKVVYHPVTGKILLVNYVHRRYGDICSNLISRCEVIEYQDDKSFDLTLARRLKSARASGLPVKVTFKTTAAFLPKSEISGANLSAMNRSTRIYKWLVAARETKRQALVRERFVVTPAAVAAVDITITAYKIIRDLIMYRAAKNSRAEVQYLGRASGGQIDSVVFYHDSVRNEQVASVTKASMRKGGIYVRAGIRTGGAPGVRLRPRYRR